MKVKLIVFICILALFSEIVLSDSGMGVSPPSVTFIYTGEGIVEGSFTVFPGGEKNIRVRPVKNLADYVFFEDDQTELREHVNGPTNIKFFIRPPEDIKPGSYTTEIVISQWITPEEKVSGFATAFAAIGMVVNLRVPSKGKFLEAKIRIKPSKINLGDVAYFYIDLLNMGTEDLNNLQANIVIKNPMGKIMSSIETTKVDILKSAKRGELRAFWRTEGQSSGVYTAEAKIDYGGDSPKEIETSIRVGDVFIEIINITSDLEESIGKILVDIQSDWNDVIENVYAELVIKGDGGIIDTIKTSSVDLEPWGKARLTAFWERKHLEPGEYDVDIFVYYYDKQANRQTRVQLRELEKGSKPDSPLLMMVAVLLGSVLFINVVWFFISLKGKKRK